MKYFFILGNNPTLSIAEIFSIVSEIEDYNFLNSDCLVIESKKEINIPKLIQRLGGTIKIGEIRDEASSANYNKIQCVLNNIVQEGKHKFNVKRFAMETKKYLKELNISCRWVISREKTLSSVVVETNKLLTEKGAEIVLIQKGSKILIGKTGAVQDFKALSFRDYDRPARDSKSGMLPPKLAQILINLSGGETEDVILDPFCGSGTVVMEAALIGYKNILGSDISEKAVSDTRENIEWIKEKFSIKDVKLNIKNISATGLSRKIKVNSVG